MANFIRELINLEGVRMLEEAEENAKGPGRQFHDRLDAFDLAERDFVKLYRLNKPSVENLINLVEDRDGVQHRTSALDSTVKVLTALRFLGSGSYQMDIGQGIYSVISQSSVSRCIKCVVNILNEPQIFNEHVRFPQNLEELNFIRDGFWNKYQFPGIVGCVDCTHIAIFPPHVNDPVYPEHIYINSKGYHSINVQLICDSNLRIFHMNATYPGGTQNSYIWNNCNALPFMRQLHNRGHTLFLLGDSGYALRPWLLTPIIDAAPGSREDAYNRSHRSICSLIERCNGILKTRFRCLLKHRVLHYAPDYCCKIAKACVVLHNICINNGVPEPAPEPYDANLDFGIYRNYDGLEMQDEGRRNRRNPELVAGERLRRNIVETYF